MARQALHDILCSILGAPFPDGKTHCYFEPPSGTDMRYPCIVYHREGNSDNFADNIHYTSSVRYTITVIDEDPDSKIPEKLTEIPYCTSDRTYSTDDLSHFVYTLYYNGPRIIKEEDSNEN